MPLHRTSKLNGGQACKSVSQSAFPLFFLDSMQSSHEATCELGLYTAVVVHARTSKGSLIIHEGWQLRRPSCRNQFSRDTVLDSQPSHGFTPGMPEAMQGHASK